MKYQDFNGEELSVLFLAFNKNLFTRPKRGEILSVSHVGDNGCTLFFEEDYLEQLTGEFQNARNNGKFAQSNANAEWLNVLNLLTTVSEALKDDYKNASDYASSCSMFWN